jgi:hypothetical protein
MRIESLSEVVSREVVGSVDEEGVTPVEKATRLSPVCSELVPALLFNTYRLIAMSGVTKEMSQKRSPSQYLAGLWSDSPEMDLVWRNSLWSQNQDNGSLSRAPSWSWTSSSWLVQFLDSKSLGSSSSLEMFFESSVYAYDVPDLNIFGTPSIPQIQITGNMFEAELTIESFELRLRNKPNMVPFKTYSSTAAKEPTQCRLVASDNPKNPFSS